MKNLLCNQEADAIGFPRFKKLYYIWMILNSKHIKIRNLVNRLGTYKWSEDADFVLECFVIGNPWFLHGLDGDFLTYNINKKLSMPFKSEIHNVSIQGTNCYGHIPVFLFLARYTAPYPPLPNFFSKKYFSLILPTSDSINIDLLIDLGWLTTFDSINLK